jgi:hypothetical protein
MRQGKGECLQSITVYSMGASAKISKRLGVFAPCGPACGRVPALCAHYVTLASLSRDASVMFNVTFNMSACPVPS